MTPEPFQLALPLAHPAPVRLEMNFAGEAIGSAVASRSGTNPPSTGSADGLARFLPVVYEIAKFITDALIEWSNVLFRQMQMRRDCADQSHVTD